MYISISRGGFRFELLFILCQRPTSSREERIKDVVLPEKFIKAAATFPVSAQRVSHEEAVRTHPLNNTFSIHTNISVAEGQALCIYTN